MTAGALRDSAERHRQKAAQQTAALRAELPLRYLRQQAHLTAPASDAKLAEKALSNATGVASRLLDRYGLDAKAVGERLGVDAGVVTSVLEEVGAPVVVLDLEDGVPPHLVDAARANVVRLAREIDRGRTLCFVRPPGITDPRCADDLVSMLVDAGHGLAANRYPIDGIVFPKVRHVHEVRWLDELLAKIEKDVSLPPDSIRVCFLFETGWGVAKLPELAAAGLNRLAGIILGTVDLGADVLLPEVRFEHPIAEWARRMIVTVAGACGVPAIDGMTLDFPVGRPELDAQANRKFVLDRMATNFNDALHSIDLGMSGRWVGHPLQLVATLLAFRSFFSEDSIREHVATLEEFSRAIANDLGAVAASSGQLLDIGTDRHVRQLLRRATAWGLLSADRAHELHLITDLERRAYTT